MSSAPASIAVAMSASLRLRQLEVGERLRRTSCARVACASASSQRAAREAERRGGDRGAEDVEVAHRELEALARLAEQRSPSRPSDFTVAIGCGATMSMRSEASTSFASTTKALMPSSALREHDVEVRDAAVRDPGLGAVEHPGVALALRAWCVIACTSEPASGSDSANAAIASPRRRFRQVFLLQLVATGERDRPAAQALHHEGEVGEAGVIGEHLAQHARSSARRAFR